MLGTPKNQIYTKIDIDVLNVAASQVAQPPPCGWVGGMELVLVSREGSWWNLVILW